MKRFLPLVAIGIMAIGSAKADLELNLTGTVGSDVVSWSFSGSLTPPIDSFLASSASQTGLVLPDDESVSDSDK